MKTLDDRGPRTVTPPDIAFLPENGDSPDPHPVRRRIFRIAYIVIVILVITGLLLMLFPWRPHRVPFPVDLPGQTIRITFAPNAFIVLRYLL
ncbi:MAG TPA: hypothetical protein VNZ58_07080 [Thermomicrobiales bacterium]|nr:hypothetical protein [Thermomicrobiales bacterium]